MTASCSRILERGLEILEHVARSRNGLSADELATAVGLHRSSVYRYLNSLSEKRYLRKTSQGVFTCGPGVLELAGVVLERMELRSVAKPFLVELCERTNATVHLCRLDGPDVVYLDKIETERSLPIHSRIGGRAPAYCTGVGKALLGFSSPERVTRVLAQTSFQAFTPNTVRDVGSLRQQLLEARERGYALDQGEHEEGIHCVAVPVFDFYGQPIAAVSVTDVPRRIGGRIRELVRQLERAAGQISSELGQSERTSAG